MIIRYSKVVIFFLLSLKLYYCIYYAFFCTIQIFNKIDVCYTIRIPNFCCSFKMGSNSWIKLHLTELVSEYGSMYFDVMRNGVWIITCTCINVFVFVFFEGVSSRYSNCMNCTLSYLMKFQAFSCMLSLINFSFYIENIYCTCLYTAGNYVWRYSYILFFIARLFS